MIVVVSKNLLAKKFNGIALWPFIIVRNKHLLNDKVFMNHERIHLQQQVELLILPFYLWYFLEYLLRYWSCGDPYRAYQNLSFEREAYSNESDMNYCEHRRFWSFTRYL